MAFSPDSSTLATSGGSDGSIQLRGRDDLGLRRVLAGHEKPVVDLAFEPSGDTLASIDSSRRVHLWRWGDGTLLPFEPGGEAGDLDDPDHIQPTVIFHPAGHLMTTPADNRTVLWDRGSGDPIATYHHEHSLAQDMAFDPTGRYLVGGDDETVRIWDAASGRPTWRGTVLLPSSALLHTHQGWLRLGPQAEAEPAPLADAAWRRAVEQRVFRASAASDDGAWLYLLTDDDQLEVWNRAEDRRHTRRPIGAGAYVWAREDGCLLWWPDPGENYLGTGTVQRQPLEGDPVRLAEHARVAGFDAPRGWILVTSEGAIQAFDDAGALQHGWPVAHAIQAATVVGDRLALGQANGTISLVSLDDGAALESFQLPMDHATQERRLWSLEPGPAGSLITTTTNGFVGVWDLEARDLLLSVKLHGIPVHRSFAGQTLLLATHVGDAAALDLGALGADYCALMQQVWQGAPAVWDGGRVVPRVPPGDHRCATAR